MKVRLELTLLWQKPPCFTYVNGALLVLIGGNLRKKRSEVSFKTRSTLASFSFIGQATKHTTVKWSMSVCWVYTIADIFQSTANEGR